jgi:pimeloyl-ACP methyl ester carboxylesterase
MWRPFLERAGGIAVDLPGFGRSGKPAEWDYGLEGFAAFLERFLDWRGLERVRLGVHDWGAAGLLLGDRVARAAAIDVLPLLPGHVWPPVVRAWRRRGVGELLMALTNRWALQRIGHVPAEHVDDVLRHLDHGTQRAILRLFRRADVEELARKGERLRDLRAPALVLWGERDPFLPVSWAEQVAAALPQAVARTVPDAGHWPWAGRPEIVEEICGFLLAA